MVLLIQNTLSTQVNQQILPLSTKRNNAPNCSIKCKNSLLISFLFQCSCSLFDVSFFPDRPHTQIHFWLLDAIRNERNLLHLQLFPYWISSHVPNTMVISVFNKSLTFLKVIFTCCYPFTFLFCGASAAMYVVPPTIWSWPTKCGLSYKKLVGYLGLVFNLKLLATSYDCLGCFWINFWKISLKLNSVFVA